MGDWVDSSGPPDASALLGGDDFALGEFDNKPYTAKSFDKQPTQTMFEASAPRTATNPDPDRPVKLEEPQSAAELSHVETAGKSVPKPVNTASNTNASSSAAHTDAASVKSEQHGDNSGSNDPSTAPTANQSASTATKTQMKLSNEEATQQMTPGAPGAVGTEPIPAKSMMIKTKKPRPYVCPTCTRSFARLEHSKRHERSHTKEKPFECPICERKFARRDLSLRHKQKSHASFSPGDQKSSSRESSHTNDMHSGASSQSGHAGGPNPGSTGANNPAWNMANGSPLSIDSMGNDKASSNSSLPGINSSMASDGHLPGDFGPQRSIKIEDSSLSPMGSASPGSDSQFPSYAPSGGSQQGTQPNFLQQLAMMGSHEYDPIASFKQARAAQMLSKTQQQQLQQQYGGSGLYTQQMPQHQASQASQQAQQAQQAQQEAQRRRASRTWQEKVAPSLRMLQSRSSRASSFSAASATSYVRQKDLDKVAPTSNNFAQGPSEVGFATPQVYPTEADSYDMEPLDSNYIDPMKLSQSPPRKRRVSMGQAQATNSKDPYNNPMGMATQALRAQICAQRQSYNQFGVVDNNDQPQNSSLLFGSSASPHQNSNTSSTTSQPPPQSQQQKSQQSQQQQQQQQQQSDEQNQPQFINQFNPFTREFDHPKPRHSSYSFSQQSQTQQQQNRQTSSQQFAGRQSEPTSSTSLGHASGMMAKTSSMRNPQGFSPSNKTDDHHSWNDQRELGFSPMGMTPGFTPGLTPGMTPGMNVPINGMSSHHNDEQPHMQDFLEKQGDDFVNSSFDADTVTANTDNFNDSLGSGLGSYPIKQPNSISGVNSIPPNASSAPASENGSQTSVNLSAGGKTGKGNASISANNASGAASTDSRPGSLNFGTGLESDNDLRRFVEAYFVGFDRHLSFVHQTNKASHSDALHSSAEQSPSLTPPSSSSSIVTYGAQNENPSSARIALSQAQAAIGAQTLGERGAAQAYYWAAKDQLSTGAPTLESVQAGSLATIVGSFSDEPEEHKSAFERLSQSVSDIQVVASALSKSALPDFVTGEFDMDWVTGADRLFDQFVSNQTRVRTIHAVHAVCVWVRRDTSSLSASMETCGCVPCYDALWRAPNSDAWLSILSNRGLDAKTVVETGGAAPNSFGSTLSQLRIGEVPLEDVSELTLESLLLALNTTSTPSRSARSALRAWESLWASSPDASSYPSPQSGPIMSDCVGIVSLMAFAPSKMNGILDALWQHNFEGVSQLVSTDLRTQSGLCGAANYAVDTLVWCEGHVTSQSIFFTTLSAVTECGFVLAEALRQISLKTSLLTPSEEQLVQRSQKSVSSVLRVPLGDTNNSPRGVLRAAACLVKLSDWPLVGTSSRALLTHTAHIGTTTNGPANGGN